MQISLVQKATIKLQQVIQHSQKKL